MGNGVCHLPNEWDKTALIRSVLTTPTNLIGGDYAQIQPEPPQILNRAALDHNPIRRNFPKKHCCYGFLLGRMIVKSICRFTKRSF